MFLRAKLDKLFFSSPPEFISSFRMHQHVSHEDGSYAIESVHTLEKLLAEMRCNNEDPVLRFLVDTTGNAWFAR